MGYPGLVDDLPVWQNWLKDLPMEKLHPVRFIILLTPVSLRVALFQIYFIAIFFDKENRPSIL